MSLISQFEQIRSFFSMQHQEYRRITDGINTEPTQTAAEIKGIRTKYDKLAENLKRQKEEVDSYLNQAARNTATHINPAAPRPYNVNAMRPLIGQGRWSDLYTEAAAQLLYVSQELNHLNTRMNAEIQTVKEKGEATQDTLDRELQDVTNKCITYLNAAAFRNFTAQLQSARMDDAAQFDTKLTEDTICIGNIKAPLDIPTYFDTFFTRAASEIFDEDTQSIKMPLEFSTAPGSILVCEYTNESEKTLYSGLQMMIMNILRRYQNSYPEMHFIDPVTHSSAGISIFAPLTQDENPLLAKVPSSDKAITERIAGLLHTRSHPEPGTALSDCFLILHNFCPAEYNQSVNHIRTLCTNASNYNMRVILTVNRSNDAHNFEALNHILVHAAKILFTGNTLTAIGANGRTHPFEWHPAPKLLPQALMDEQKRRNIKKPDGNSFAGRVGLDVKQIPKGNRKIENIPYGLDTNQDLVYLDFEKSNFASFICGASRSGKSNLLQVILTSIFLNYHPDDVEVWLIDFKMTEFSRYIQHKAPHIRYLILDDSPDIVCDIVDRLSEILKKRQNIFKGQWKKMDEVPLSKYMPAMFIVIDEFSVMSEILADAGNYGDGNYAVKMQMLLAKGAALGMHFIFASQGFTTGAKGLNEFAKKQVQQRIAMKTDFDEIRATLDLKSTSDNDKTLMDQLPVYHALQRIPETAGGDHLLYVNVLNISDDAMEQQQVDAIDAMNKLYRTHTTYRPRDSKCYVNKQTLYIDGNTYRSFEKEEPEMQLYIDLHQDEMAEYDEIALFLGEPRKMVPLYPITISNDYCENILMIAPNSEKMPAAAIMMSIERMGNYQDYMTEYWAEPKNQLYRQVKEAAGYIPEYVGLEDVCSRIKAIRQAIEAGQQGNLLVAMLGFDILMTEMQFQESKDETDDEMFGFYPPASDEPTLDEILARMRAERDATDQQGTEAPAPEPKPEPEPEPEPDMDDEPDTDAYDAREDLKFILTQGPRLGYHFILVFSNVHGFNKTRIDPDLCRHKLVFRTSRNDASEIGLTGNDRNGAADLPEHVFRYSNGLDGLSFRPYLHYGLSWDGWELSEKGEVEIKRDDAYLL